jgi:hypothetical protein
MVAQRVAQIVVVRIERRQIERETAAEQLAERRLLFIRQPLAEQTPQPSRLTT